MKTKLKEQGACKCSLEITITQEEVAEAFRVVYDDLQKQAKIPGFRKGKVPQDLLVKHYGETARDEVLKRLIPGAYQKALAEHRIDPVSMPEIRDVNFAADMNLSFKANVETRPVIKLRKYKGISLKGQKVEITPKEMDDAITRLQESHAEFTPITDTRPVKKGDYLICDVESFSDGKPISKK